MSWIDAEMSRLKGEIRVLTRERDAAIKTVGQLQAPARQLADYFISKTNNLVIMRCTYCEHAWVRDGRQEHDTDCPVGLVIDALEIR